MLSWLIEFVWLMELPCPIVSWLMEPEDDIWLMELPCPMVSWLMVE